MFIEKQLTLYTPHGSTTTFSVNLATTTSHVNPIGSLFYSPWLVDKVVIYIFMLIIVDRVF